MTILPVFLPHVGCGNRCIYCNQSHITNRIGTDDIREQLASLFEGVKQPAQVALYGGNPLGLEPLSLDRIFQLFDPYLDKILSFRISIKPRSMSKEIIHILKKRNVCSIELGVPCFNDTTLTTLQRGHTAADAIHAFQMLRKEGFEVGIQVMVGLPEETFDDVKETVCHIVSLVPSFIRIYPLVVIKDTPLFRLFEDGQYSPDTIEEAVTKSAFVYTNAWKHKIKTIKMGLTENDVLKKKIAAGPFHPAFGYLVKSEAFRLAMAATCRRAHMTGTVLVRLHDNDLPHLIGLNRSNIEKLRQENIAVSWATDKTTTPGHFVIENRTEAIPGDLADGLAAFQWWTPRPPVRPFAIA
jgi:histone acetyltransferase (RNA polymerase elongator complex component)